MPQAAKRLQKFVGGSAAAVPWRVLGDEPRESGRSAGCTPLCHKSALLWGKPERLEGSDARFSV
jgi:hypothetical protein